MWGLGGNVRVGRGGWGRLGGVDVGVGRECEGWEGWMGGLGEVDGGLGGNVRVGRGGCGGWEGECDGWEGWMGGVWEG